MPFLRDARIELKITLIMLLACGIVAVLMTAGFVGYSVFRARADLATELATAAEIIGRTSAAALTFQDRRAARETLATTIAIRALKGASLYDRDGKLFASSRRGGAKLFPESRRHAGQYYEGEELLYFRNIELDGEKIGLVGLRFDTAIFYKRFWSYLPVAVGLMFAGALAGWFVSRRLQRLISRPIVELAATARVVSQQKSYSVRAARHGGDEIGMLIDAFNEMLAQIQTRTEDLLRLNDELRGASRKPRTPHASRASSWPT